MNIHYTAGVISRCLGGRKGDNPYPTNSQEHQEWLKGYNDRKRKDYEAAFGVLKTVEEN